MQDRVDGFNEAEARTPRIVGRASADGCDGFNEAEARTPRIGAEVDVIGICARFNEAEARTPRIGRAFGVRAGGVLLQ